MEDAYPPIFYVTKILNHGDGQCLAVVIPGSGDRPHFAGPSYVRVGSENRVASESQFDSLIAERQSKPYEILRWSGKQVTVDYMNPESSARMLGPVASTDVLTVRSCNPFYATLEKTPAQQVCIPLHRVGISFDPERNRLKLEVAPV
jgi:hypothetical protein